MTDSKWFESKPFVRIARIATAVLAALSASALLAIAWLLLFAPPGAAMSGLVADDAGYYIAIARNFALGFGASFDRLHPTNGFNPLEFAVLSGVFRLLPRSLPVLACYRAAMLADFLVGLAGLWLFMRLVSRRLAAPAFGGESRRLMLAACAAFYAMFVLAKSHYGVDAWLVLLIGNAYFVRVQKRGLLAPGAGAAVADGALLGLVFLARVDSLPLLVAAFGLMGLLAIGTRGAWRGIGVRASICALLAAPFVVSNQIQFGTWLPVSAHIKSAFPRIDVAASLAVIRHSSLPPLDQFAFLVAFVGSLVTTVWLLSRARRDGVREALSDGPSQLLAVMSLYVLARLSYMLLFSRCDVQGSYGILSHVYNVLGFVTLIEAAAARTGARSRRLASSVVVAGAAALAAFSLAVLALKVQVLMGRSAQRVHEGWVDDATFGEAVRRATPEGAVIFGGSFGVAGLFADRAWINGDGVANSYAYQRALAAGALREYLHANRVGFVAFLSDSATLRGVAPIPVNVTGALSGRVNTIEIDPRDAVLARRVARGAGPLCVIARYRP
jgi:hypothetical protein